MAEDYVEAIAKAMWQADSSRNYKWKHESDEIRRLWCVSAAKFLAAVAATGYTETRDYIDMLAKAVDQERGHVSAVASVWSKEAVSRVLRAIAATGCYVVPRKPE